MEEKTRSTPFSISNILNSASSREHGRREPDNITETAEAQDRQRSEFSRAQNCEIRRPDESPVDLDRRMGYDFDDWSRTSVEG